MSREKYSCTGPTILDKSGKFLFYQNQTRKEPLSKHSPSPHLPQAQNPVPLIQFLACFSDPLKKFPIFRKYSQQQFPCGVINRRDFFVTDSLFTDLFDFGQRSKDKANFRKDIRNDDRCSLYSEVKKSYETNLCH